MHIPDGFLSPQTFLPAWALAGVAWAVAGRGLRHSLDERSVPRLAMLTALAYGLGLVMLPLPGGTSGHLLGIALLAWLAGARAAFAAYSLVLLLQALLFGAGGVTALPVNALLLGGVGALLAVASRWLLGRCCETLALALGAWLAVVVPSALLALVLGLQPVLAQDTEGRPLFFPFGIAVTLPALVLPHLLIGMAEAALSVLVWRLGKTRGWFS